MKQEGMAANVDIDIDMFANKEFYTFRKTKHLNESIYFRWNWLNFVNKHYTR